ncbi:deoxyxylulose-5-phosphate synthase [Streptomyces sp. NPDC021020]|uniref:deoxyxylulose-5-phosphate synthase n=1 Tax=Streptomyces sp. NPDC021020 TaxID=3365109 RepID=UPI00378DEBE6
MGRIRSTHYVCLPCRASWKIPLARDTAGTCPRCAGRLINAGTQFAAPRRRDTAAWRALGAVLASGLRFHSACECCQDGPGYRPRTPREVRERLAHAAATGAPVAVALQCRDVTHSGDAPGRCML